MTLTFTCTSPTPPPAAVDLRDAEPPAVPRQGLPAIDMGVISADGGAAAGLVRREGHQRWSRDPTERDGEAGQGEAGQGQEVSGGEGEEGETGGSPPPSPVDAGGVVVFPSLPLSLPLPSPSPEVPIVSCSSSSLPALRHLNLGRCGGVTDLALSRVAGAFPGLEGVHLEHCLRVTDVGVAALAVGCRGLRALGLRNCGQVCWTVLSLSLSLVLWSGEKGCHEKPANCLTVPLTVPRTVPLSFVEPLEDKTAIKEGTSPQQRRDPVR